MKRLRLCLIRATLGLLALALLAVGAAWARLAMWRHGKLSALEARSAVARTCAGPVEYESRGAGPAVLALHGGFGGFDQAQMFLPGLTEAGFRVIAPSRPGYLRTPLSAGETDAIASCLACIRSCQLPDGAFAQVAPAGNAAAPVWIAPYFANFAALALLAGHAHTPSPEDLARVSRWLTWCARHQAPGGYWTDFEGTSASYADTGKVDAWDSSAALFLNVLAGYRRAGGKVQPAWLDAAQRASACLEALTDKDGLTWAKPDYRVKFLLDNIEVCVGWRAAAEVFAAAGATADAERARFRADRLISFSLPNYWQPDAGRFSHARLADGTLAPAGPQPYPHGLAQLYGIAFVHPYSSAWSSVNRAYQPDASPSAAFGPEWWLAAAASVSEDDARLWRRRVCQAVAAFDPARTYLHRYALSALALLDGAQWLQSNAP